MYADVVVSATGLHTDRVFTYTIPESLDRAVVVGSAVTVPFGKRIVPGWVVARKQSTSVRTKPITELRYPRPVLPLISLQLAWFLKHYYKAPLPACFKTVSLFQKTIRSRHPVVLPSKGILPPPLSTFQKRAVATILRERSRAAPFLLHGITGSGKTEVYLAVMERLLKTAKKAASVILLVPEISLTPQTVQRVSDRFPGVVCWHSALSAGEKFKTVEAILTGKAQIIVGSRSAIFAPVRSLACIIIDEEHDPSFKQDTIPRYDSRTVASFLSTKHHCPLILGSATPRIVTLCTKTRLVLPTRIRQAALPSITVVDMREELRAGNRLMISERLHAAIAETFARHEQTILFLNRRGTAVALLCRACGYIEKCPNCAVAMTLHRGNRLICHSCGAKRSVENSCPSCGKDVFRPFGSGTQRIESQIQESFPDAWVVRMDRDTTRRKGSHEKIFSAMRDGKIDILIGTQMITKGWDIPNVTLVGILAADLSLTFPDFTASERTVQLLTQVAGRAGRGTKRGRVILQTYNPNHPVIQAIATHDLDRFYRQEQEERRSFGYPPFVVLARISFSHVHETVAFEKVQELKKTLDATAKDISILGPTFPLVPKRRGRTTAMLVLKAKNRRSLDRCLARVPPEFTIDVDPINLL